MYMSEDLRLPSSAIAASLPEIEARFKESLSAITYLSVDALPVPGTIRFKRNHTAKWDSKRKAFIPLDKPYWDWERTTLIVLAAGDLVDKLSQGGRHLIAWVKDTRLILGVAQDEPIGILIQGLGKMLAQRRAAANRQYTAAARAGLSSDATSRLDTSLRPDMDKDAIDAELVKLQVAERVFIVHRESNEATIGLTDPSVEKTEEIEDWIWNLAADVAIRPVGPVDMGHGEILIDLFSPVQAGFKVSPLLRPNGSPQESSLHYERSRAHVAGSSRSHTVCGRRYSSPVSHVRRSNGGF